MIDPVPHPQPHPDGPVVGAPGLVVQAALGRARSLLLYRGLHDGKPVLAIEYAPVGVTERLGDGALRAVDYPESVAHAAASWRKQASQTAIWLDERESRTVGNGRALQATDWLILPLNGSGIISLAEWVGEGEGARPLGPAAAASLTRALARGMLLTHQSGSSNLNISPLTLFQLAPDDHWAPTQALAPLPDERGLFEPALYNQGIPRHYSAPEMRDAAMRLDVGRLSDIYSASAVIAYAISGEPPPDFAARVDPGEWLAAHPLAAAHDDQFRSAIAAGLAPAPRDRPQSVSDWLEGFGIGPKPSRGGMMAMGWQWAARQPAQMPGRDDGGKVVVTTGSGAASGNLDANGALQTPIKPVDMPTGAPDEPVQAPTPLPQSAGQGIGWFLIGMIGAAALIGLGLILAAMLETAGMFDHDGAAIATWAAIAGLVALLAGLGLNSPNVVRRRERQGALTFAIPATFVLALTSAAQWPESPTPETATVEGATEAAPAEDTMEAEPDLSELLGNRVYVLSGSNWVDLSVFEGAFRPESGTCFSDGSGALEISFGQPAPTDRGVLFRDAVRKPDGFSYDLLLPAAVAGGASPNRTEASLNALRTWRAASDSELYFVIDNVRRRDGQPVNPDQPSQAQLSERPDGRLILTTRYLGNDGPESVGLYASCGAAAAAGSAAEAGEAAARAGAEAAIEEMKK